jgi:hypothetical protein
MRNPDFPTQLSMNGYVLEMNISKILLVAHYFIASANDGSLINVTTRLNYALPDHSRYVLVTRPIICKVLA